MELISEEKYSICHGCLSKNRSRTPLGDNYDVYLMLLNGVQRSDELTKDLLICWECIARLKSIKAFQDRIINAQNVLQQYLCQLIDCPKSLSTLKTQIQTDKYDYSLQFDSTIGINNSLFRSPEIKHESLIDVKSLPLIEYNNLSDNDAIDTDNHLIDNDYDDNQLTETHNQLSGPCNRLAGSHNQLSGLHNDLTGFHDNIIDSNNSNKSLSNSIVANFQIVNVDKKCIKDKNVIRKIRNNISIRKYEKYALIEKKMHLEGDVLKKWYVKLKISEKEMETLLDRDRNCKATWKFEKKCLNCGLVYRRSIDLKRHIAFHHMKAKHSLKCAQCKTKCPSLGELRTHWLTSHTSVYKCTVCETTCRDTSEISRHVDKEHGASYVCTLCGVSTSTLKSFSEHYKETHEKVVCDYCQRSFKKKSTLIKHIKYKHTPPVCDICSRVLQNHKALTKHRYIVHAITVRGPQPRDLAYCVECDKQFPTIYKYKYHLSQSPRHQNKKKFMKACPECGKVFSRTACMNHHYKLVHLKDTKYKCDICNKCFAMSSRLKQHQRVVHQKIGLPKNKMCDICGRGFTTNRILIEHRRTHTGERPYKCTYCEYAFAQKGAMLVHQRTQHKNIVPNN